MIFKVEPRDVQRAWDSGAHKLAEAMSRTDEATADQLLGDLKFGRYDLIGTYDPESWMAVTVKVCPQYRALWIYAIWARGALSGLDQLKDYARANGCDRIQGACDDVIARLWARKGFTKAYTVMEMKT